MMAALKVRAETAERALAEEKAKKSVHPCNCSNELIATLRARVEEVEGMEKTAARDAETIRRLGRNTMANPDCPKCGWTMSFQDEDGKINTSLPLVCNYKMCQRLRNAERLLAESSAREEKLTAKVHEAACLVLASVTSEDGLDGSDVPKWIMDYGLEIANRLSSTPAKPSEPREDA